MDTPSRNYPPDDQRVSDANRDHAVSGLSEAFQAGRITADEFEQRSGRALSARTGKELTDLFTDLQEDNVPAARTAAGRLASPRAASRWAAATRARSRARRSAARRSAPRTRRQKSMTEARVSSQASGPAEPRPCDIRAGSGYCVIRGDGLLPAKIEVSHATTLAGQKAIYVSVACRRIHCDQRR